MESRSILQNCRIDAVLTGRYVWHTFPTMWSRNFKEQPMPYNSISTFLDRFDAQREKEVSDTIEANLLARMERLLENPGRLRRKLVHRFEDTDLTVGDYLYRAVEDLRGPVDRSYINYAYGEGLDEFLMPAIMETIVDSDDPASCSIFLMINVAHPVVNLWRLGEAHINRDLAWEAAWALAQTGHMVETYLAQSDLPLLTRAQTV